VINSVAAHIMLVENQKTLKRICRNVDRGGRTYVLVSAMYFPLGIEDALL